MAAEMEMNAEMDAEMDMECHYCGKKERSRGAGYDIGGVKLPLLLLF